MKTNQFFLFFTIMIILIVVGCNFIGETIQGEGPITSENRDISAFSEIDLNFNADVVFTQSPKTSLAIETNQNLMEHIEITNEGDALKLTTKDNANLESDQPIKIYISGPDINVLSVNGSGTISVPEKLTTSKLLCSINGSGDILAEVVYGGKSEFEINGSGEIAFSKWYGSSYDIEINGSGDVSLDKGKSDNGAVEINGSGDVDVMGLETSNVEVEISGSGDVKVFANNKLSVEIAGSGDVSYKGDAEVEVDEHGSGDLHKMF